MTAATEERVVTEVQGHTLVITMVRHTKRNAIDGEMTLALDAALNRLEDESPLWVGVLNGGPDMFCAGTDMAATSGTAPPPSAAASTAWSAAPAPNP